MRGMRLFVTTVAAVVLVHGAGTASPATHLDPAYQEINVYETGEVSVTVNDEVLGVTGYDLLIEYDPMVVEPVGVSEGTLPAGYAGDTFLYWDVDDLNRLLINGAVLGGSVDGPGTLVVIEFMGLADGMSSLEFGTSELRDIDNEGIPTTWEGATIQVVGAVPVEGSTWTRLKALFD
ncbi:MAG: hypothetical protein GF405_02530 [Candidatus Eisenbacteria bacterium]|nr:hypothetical protein [Candidatus Eisenbacteria bacterium]